MWLGNKKPTLFFKKERIVRHIYSPHNFNLSTRKLKPNILQFTFNQNTQKNELSCNRLELESLSHCRMIGKHNARPPKNEYFGFACTNKDLIRKHQAYSLFYSPMFNRNVLNYTHSNIYDNGNPPVQIGAALSSKMSIEREMFLKIWVPYMDEERLIQKKFIEAPLQ